MEAQLYCSNIIKTHLKVKQLSAQRGWMFYIFTGKHILRFKLLWFMFTDDI